MQRACEFRNHFRDIEFGDLVALGWVRGPGESPQGTALELSPQGHLLEGGRALEGELQLVFRRPDGGLLSVPFVLGRVEPEPSRWVRGPAPEPEPLDEDDWLPQLRDDEDWSRPFGLEAEAPELIVLAGPHEGRALRCERDGGALGFDPEGAPRWLASREAAVAELSGGRRPTIRARLGGRPLRLNGRRLGRRPRTLRHGDLLRHGETVLVFSEGGGQPLLDHELEAAWS